MQLEAEKELQVFNGSNPGIWTLFTDGSSNVKGAGLGIVSVPPTGETIRQAIKCRSITNNEAGYEAVIAGLELARELGINQIVIKSDSQLVANQMLGTYTTMEARMQQYLEKVRDLIRQFQTWNVMQISRDENVEANTLANLAYTSDVASNENASVILLFHLVLDPDKNEVNFNNLNWYWRNEIVVFLQYGTVPEDKKKAHALWKNAARYCLKQGNLYRKMFGGPLARCLGPSQMEYVMREIHEGHCENHTGGRSLVRTMIRAGYYWTKMEEEAKILWLNVTNAKVEIGEPSTRFTQASEKSNNEEIRINLDLLEGKREAALIKMAAQKHAANAGKLSPTWEGPYRIHDIAGKGAYELETMDGKILPSHWNVIHLKRYYF
ncbi:uncharacterized protein [Nicotiana sylvestris]|uniref:uncharacterized protein n=1 Tax=Nicotiana sylvestris TaxID=4096 RepID=UPI00388CD113